MRILINSKYLAAQLNSIDFDNDRVKSVDRTENGVILRTKEMDIKLECESYSGTYGYNQRNRRWDWVKTLMNKVEEQPVILHLTDDSLNVIFQY